jgi:DNA (cytosine-5)-methyltransferase 1
LPVKVRKYEVDTEKLKIVLKQFKKESKLTIRQIAALTDRPKTEVDHWFRSDNCFSIPSPDIWFQLKDILNIHNDEFDEAIVTFMEREGVFDQANRVYDTQGLSPTVTASGEIKIFEPINLKYNKYINSGECLMINNKEELKVLSLFSGVGAFEMALRNIGAKFNLIGFSEIDKNAIKSYCAIHGVSEELNFGDVSKVDSNSIPDFDLMTYGFPCQDISVAGKKQGLSEGSGTRSSLLWEAMKIAETKKPKYMIAENVKGLVGKKFKNDFDKWITQLDELGYNTYYEVINSKDFGSPQSRERVFVVSIRKDIETEKFEFPQGLGCEKVVRDILEESVEQKYYLKDTLQDLFELYDVEKEGLTPKLQQIGNVNHPKYHDFSNRVYDSNQLARTVMGGGGNNNDKAGQYLISGKIRRLTPKECWRVMGFSDLDFDNAKSVGVSETQLYKQAGNSIDVKVLENLFYSLLMKNEVAK